MAKNGIYVTSIKMTNMDNQKGQRFLDALSMDTFPMAHPTKSVDPTGGVTNPMDRFSIMMMPK